jgi:hypothetical protein
MSPDQLRAYGPYLVIGLVALVFIWRMRRLSQTRRLRVEWLWVSPAIMAVIVALNLYFAPGIPRPEGLDWAWLAGGFVIGGVLGWWRGKMMDISVDPATHVLNTKASPAALIFIVVLMLIRSAVRGVAMGEASTLHLTVAAITGAFLTMAVGLIAVGRLEMAIRANRLLNQARAAKAAAASA